MVDLISQICIAVFGVGAIILVSLKNKYGFILGLISQPFWVITLVINEQWIILFLSAIYTGSWCFGIYNWFFKKEKPK